MLHLEPNKEFIVYPSWAELSYAWEQLPRLLADPSNSGYVKDFDDYEQFGFPRVIQSFELIDGPGGGGIIKVEGQNLKNWLPSLVLAKEANIRAPAGMWLVEKTFDPDVYYLEPRDERLWKQKGLKKKRLYLCGATTEHVESAGDNVIYWIVGYKKGKKSIDALEHLPGWAKQFGLEVSVLTEVPELVYEKTRPWFVDPSYQYVWFDVCGGGNGVGYHFAVVLYLGMHLSWVTSRCAHWMHLVSNIEGKPQIRKLLARR